MKLFARPALLAIALGLLYFALGTSGFGTDNDTYEMARRGREFLRDGTYWPSRSPGYPLPELVIGSLAYTGGHLASNALSALLGVLAASVFYLLLKDVFGPGKALLSTVVAALNPYWIIACSSSMDYVYATAFCLAGILAARHGRLYAAAALLAAAVASRATYLPYGLIVYAFVAFRALGAQPGASSRADVRRVLAAAGVYLTLAVLPYALIYRAVGGEMFRVYTGEPVPFFSLEGYARLSDYVGRFAFKNVFLWGVPMFILLAVAGAAWLVKRRGASRAAGPRGLAWAVGAALLYSEALFFRLPLEVSYLLPTLFLGVFLLNHVPKARAFLALAIVAQVSYSVVSIELLEVRYAFKSFSGRGAEGASFSPHFGPGVLVKDLADRREAEIHNIGRFGLVDLPSRHVP